MADTNAQNFEKSILPWLGKTGKMLHIFMAGKLSQHGFKMTVEQFIILKILHEENGRPQNDMAIVTNRHKASLTRILDTMEKNHLVVRISDPNDRRVKRVHLTKHGRQYFDSMQLVIAEAASEVQNGLAKEEIKSLIAILQKVQRNINLCDAQK